MTLRIRRGAAADIPALQAFFRAAYGNRTIFQDVDFVTWYLGADDGALNNFIAFDDSGTIVSHYGWIPTQLAWSGIVSPHIWGVNAFTLPELRGSGLGKELVERVREVSPSFGVIGFNPKTAEFYAQNGFNVFERKRFTRHVLVLDVAVREIMTLIGATDHPRAGTLQVVLPMREESATESAMSSDPASWHDEVVDSMARFCTPVRSRRWLSWRYSQRSQLDYRVVVRDDEGGRAVVAYRAVSLPPTGHAMTKIVDLYGDPGAVRTLLLLVRREAELAGHLYVEAATFGGPYRALLDELGFSSFEDDEYEIVPSLTNPVGSRANHEYVGILAGFAPDLTPGDVYFTPADSDRDRRGAVSR